jgi:hypothetical protein
MSMTVAMIDVDSLPGVWPHIREWVEQSCQSNEITAGDLAVSEVYELVASGMLALFVGYHDTQPAAVLGIQFHEDGTNRGSDIVVFGGTRMMEFYRRFWSVIVQWLQANGIQYVGSYANDRLARIYRERLGFTQGCHYVRMPIPRGAAHE